MRRILVTCTFGNMRKIRWWCHSISKFLWSGGQDTICSGCAGMALKCIICNASAPEKHLKTQVNGAIEALQVLIGYQQHSMPHMSIYLPTEVKATVRMLKGKTHLEEFPPDSQYIFHITVFQVYFLQPKELNHITYPNLYKWWRQHLPGETQRAICQMKQQLTAELEISEERVK